MKTLLTTILLMFAVTGWGQVDKPFLHYSFDNTLIDSMLTGNDLKAYGNVSFSTVQTAVGSHSALFDGTKDYYRIPASDWGDEFFVSFWFRHIGTISSYQALIYSTDVDSSWLVRGRATNSLELATGANQLQSYATVSGDAWYHVVAYFNKTSAVGRYWINGTKVATTDSTIRNYFDSKDSVFIGVDYYTNAGWYGYIDELRVYSGFAPSEAQIDSLYELSYVVGYVEPTAYNPTAERHARFFKEGVEKKDKDDEYGFVYWVAKSPVIIALSDTIGILADIRSGDYDGVCPSGATRWSDTDCAVNNFQYAPLRKIKDTTDYATKVYIDPTYGSGGNGTLANPYDSWTDITATTGTAYLIKCGTQLNISSPITLDETNILLGSYGTGEKPKIVNTAVNHVVIIQADSCTVRDLVIRNKSTLQNAISTETRYSYSNIHLTGYRFNTDIFNTEMRAGCFGIGVLSGNHYVLRVVKCVIDSMFTEGMFPVVRDYLEVSWTTLSNINMSYAISSNTSYKGTPNSWATGDGIERYDYGNGWKEQWVHHTTIDRRPYGNKAGIMFHNNTIDHVKDITEFCTFYAPLNNGISGQSSQCINSSGTYGESVFLNNIFHGVECDYATTAIVEGGSDTISGNVFNGFDYAIQGGLNGIIENNTFYNNVNAIYRGSGSIAKLFNNIFWMNTTNLNTITAASSGNNLYTDPSFVDAANNNFKLNSGSNAIDAGVTVPYRLYDIDGTPVPQNIITDIGAIEYEP